MPFVRGVWMQRVSAGAVALALAGLAGCSHIPLVGHAKAPVAPASATGSLGVNRYLWHA